MPRTVAIASQKGGVGKTTISMGLAGLSSEYLKTLLVDIDKQGSANYWIEQIEATGRQLSFDFTQDTDPANLATLRHLDQYDMIVVDTPGSLDDPARFEAVLSACDFVVIPVLAEVLSLAPIVTTIQELIIPRQLEYGVLVNKVSPRPDGKLDLQDCHQLLDNEGIRYFSAAIRHYKAVSTAPLAGRTVADFQATEKAEAQAIIDMQKFVGELFARVGPSLPTTVDLRENTDAGATQ